MNCPEICAYQEHMFDIISDNNKIKGDTMLNDIERKLLRIIANYSAGRSRMPMIDELCTKTGRDPDKVKEILKALTREGYIIWSESEPKKIVLIEAWERPSSVSSSVKTSYERFMD